MSGPLKNIVFWWCPHDQNPQAPSGSKELINQSPTHQSEACEGKALKTEAAQVRHGSVSPALNDSSTPAFLCQRWKTDLLFLHNKRINGNLLTLHTWKCCHLPCEYKQPALLNRDGILKLICHSRQILQIAGLQLRGPLLCINHYWNNSTGLCQQIW